jgi:hypothetical protein
MKLHHVVGLFVLGAALVALSPTPSSAAGGKKGKGKNVARKLEDIALIHELRKTAHLLSKADRDYKGHRAAAVKQIKLAIHDLTKEAHLRGHKVPSGYTGPESQPVSDAQLKKASQHLGNILNQINNLKATKQRTKAAEHLVKAIAELKTALTIA